MIEIEEKGDLFNGLRQIIWDTYPYAVLKKVYFMDKCSCYSEVTLEPCELNIELVLPTNKGDITIIESRVRFWAENNLQWSGCSSCDSVLDIDIRFFLLEGYKEDWIASSPLKALLENSTLYAGQKAIDKVTVLVEKQTMDNSIKPIVVHMGHFTGRRQSYLVIVRKIDQYDDGHIGIYSSHGVLPLYPETPITSELIVEAVEIPY